MTHADYSNKMDKNTSQHIEIKHHNQHLILTLDGEIDAYMVTQFRPYISNALDEESKTSILINLETVTFLDSHAIGLFVHILKRTHAVNGILGFAGATGQPASVLNMVGFNDELVSYFDTLDDAIKQLDKEV